MGPPALGRSIIRGDPTLARRIDLALDVLAEEARALELKGAGDHFGGPIVVETPDYRGLDSDAVGFSQDTEWMPRVVLMAKSTYVWLEQLAARHERAVATLADVPDQELDRLAELGVTGLWLIGLWQRSRASAEIKRRRGDADAVASAYAIDEYRIADDLGGEAAFEDLKRRAGDRGIQIAADMVPNHMGIDSRWVIEHPDRFISLPDPPFPAYSFTGPNLSQDGRVDIQIEDHYWDGTDAAVVFRRRDTQSNEERFIYHGNDGTSYPWNDTAQLDYLNPEVREAVIQTILGVARRHRSSGSMQRWSWRAGTSAGCGSPTPAPAGRSRPVPSTRSRLASSTSACRRSSGARSSTGSPRRRRGPCSWRRRSG